MMWVGVVAVLMTGCSPVIASLSDGDGAGAGAGTGGDGTDSGDPDSGTTPDEPGKTLTSGRWALSQAETLKDPCGWNQALVDFTGIRINDLLPSEFDVEAEEGRFEIEAVDYGAEGSIDCEFTDEEFSCDLQTVSPEIYDLGAYGWLYEITFTGSYVDDETIEGQAVVDYPSVDEGSAQAFDYYDIDPDDCSQTFGLTITYSGR